ncbi:VOC family protein [Rhizobium sullae]|uniref:VOC family protein n=1 Tax=Rhizobium sullae TaxID=50338 RepID=UPI00315D4C18
MEFFACRKLIQFVIDDLSKLCTILEKAGFPTVSDQPLEGYLRRYVNDPFGNRIELMQIVHA